MLRGEGSELGVRKESWGLPSLLAPTEVVGTLKHSITFGLLPSLQLTPACFSLLQLQLAPSSLTSLPVCSPHYSLLQLASACSPYSQLTSGTQRCSGSKGSKLGVRGASWELPEAPGRFQESQKCSGSKGSKLGVRGASWELPEAPGRFQEPRDAVGARGARWE